MVTSSPMGGHNSTIIKHATWSKWMGTSALVRHWSIGLFLKGENFVELDNWDTVRHMLKLHKIRHWDLH